MAVPDRQPTATSPSTPLNLDVYALAQDFDAALADVVRRHGGTENVPTDRTALAVYAADLAARDRKAADDLDVEELVGALRAAMLIGEADGILGRIACPKCLCWSLLPVRCGGRWRAACQNVRCAYDSDPRYSDDDAQGPGRSGPRTWSLYAIARHHVRRRHAA
ncbi:MULTISPECIES: hypothetical protein [Streptomycetaceae]|uniref:Uncharacterized protein n=1 Tax=Streptantibioticus cattleyicolor (strain ATCC 35852 / DSM 46488 / JCM 4925 / NBRC 14057 / NRRL 8057) TaxID=1003195 RepID=F8JT60_STREN|nr:MULTISPECIES: hypothetical protein [Streptomycetaceae]AEW93007.1 hypothetical protein SCATT_06360 [Streptantibioticus cattleyicolor NRRL 8057 = DSM 46488]MYS57743.1 hypothetical protein [Streptomyces sp. SID5468]CCB73366.1 protein of unknown function [Streptantibioticus cattleyicolor NRRL 8057 = DSM 46488]